MTTLAQRNRKRKLKELSDNRMKLREDCIKSGESSYERRLPHYHADEHGFLQKCFHQSTEILFSWKFWLGTLTATTLTFPVEHYLYTYVWPFNLVSKWLGL